MTRRKPREWTAEDIAAVKKWEAARIAERRCPWSGLPLGGDPAEVVWRCSICDCAGYRPEEVGKP